MEDNWVERRFTREQHLNKSDDLWQAISTEIHNACKSLTARYPETGQAKFIPQNGHRILVEMTHSKNERMNLPMDMKRRVTLTFNGKDINVTLDEHPAKIVSIDSDLEGCFLKYQQRKMSVDQFSEMVLRDAFFTPRNPHAPKSPAPGPWTWT
jgi:hypothetical protein